jgi:hypothetical protein
MSCKRLLVLLMLLSGSSVIYAAISDGSTRYDLTAQALANMTDEVVLTMGYVVGLVYAVASLTAIYNATVIYIKLNAGEEGFMKSVLMLVGSIMFLIGATIVLPAFFGYNSGSSGYSPFG